MAEDINESIERLEELLTRLVPERTATPIQPAWSSNDWHPCHQRR
jgi:hypothetical protein